MGVTNNDGLFGLGVLIDFNFPVCALLRIGIETLRFCWEDSLRFCMLAPTGVLCNDGRGGTVLGVSLEERRGGRGCEVRRDERCAGSKGAPNLKPKLTFCSCWVL